MCIHHRPIVFAQNRYPYLIYGVAYRGGDADMGPAVGGTRSVEDGFECLEGENADVVQERI